MGNSTFIIKLILWILIKVSINVSQNVSIKASNYILLEFIKLIIFKNNS